MRKGGGGGLGLITGVGTYRGGTRALLIGVCKTWNPFSAGESLLTDFVYGHAYTNSLCLYWRRLCYKMRISIINDQLKLYLFYCYFSMETLDISRVLSFGRMQGRRKGGGGQILYISYIKC